MLIRHTCLAQENVTMKTITSVALTLAFLAPLGLAACADEADPPTEAQMPEAQSDIDAPPVTEPTSDTETTNEQLGIEPGTTNTIGDLPEDGEAVDLQGDGTDYDQ
jgi:hypothetical protein